MDKKQFDLSVSLFETLADIKLSSGQNIRDALRLDGMVSLFDIVASYMTLYRFPLLFSQKKGIRERWRFYIRPYRGLAMHCKETFQTLFKLNDTGCKQWNKERPTALFLGFVPTFYRDVLRPVAEKLIADEDVNVVVYKTQSLFEHWDDTVKQSITEMKRRLKTVKKIILHRIRSSDAFQKMNSFSRFALVKEFQWLFWREFKRLIPQVAIAKHILNKHRPIFIVSADDADQRCRVYSLLAKKMGVPTLLVQQGLSNGDYPEWRFFTQDVVAAMGETSQCDMISQGVPSDSIVVTGHPGFDQYASIKADSCLDVRNKLGLTVGQKMVLFASQPYFVGMFNDPNVRREMITAVVSAVKDLKDIILVVKPHPGEKISELKKLIGGRKDVRIINQMMDISSLIKACDILITFFSTTALQALYAKKPVINVDFYNSGIKNPYLESGATWIARTPGDISKHIKTLTAVGKKGLNERAAHRERFLRDMTYIPDGRSSERVVKVIKSILYK